MPIKFCNRGIFMVLFKKVLLMSVFLPIIIGAIILLVGCSCSRRTASAKVGEIISQKTPKYDLMFPTEAHSVYSLQADVDLNGKTYLIPEGVTIVHKKGLIKNGVLIGNGTIIKASKAIFDKVTIKGSWNVNKISTSLFNDLSYKNALRDVMALSNPSVQNDVVIEDGRYVFDAEKSNATLISLCSNTNLTFNGTIETVPNSFKSYNIVSIVGNNIKVSGSGTIKGDKTYHTGTEGEWGMGIYITKASNCKVTGLTVRDCWGDCIYVGNGSNNIILSNLTLINGRRQGISITDGENIKVANTTITDVSGTSPGYAIDIEPNKQNHIRNVIIENVTTRNCDGGFVVSVIHPDVASVNGVSFNKCKVESVQDRYPLVLNKCKNITVKRSIFGSCTHSYSCAISKVEGVEFIDNTIYTKDVVINDISNVSLIGNEVYGNALYQEGIKSMLISKRNIRNNKIHKTR